MNRQDNQIYIKMIQFHLKQGRFKFIVKVLQTYLNLAKCKIQKKLMLKLEKVSRFKKQQIDHPPPKVSQQKEEPFAHNQYPIFEQQFDPQFIHAHFLQQGMSYFSSIYQSTYNERHFEDSILTTYIDNKIVLIQYTMMSLALVSIFLSIFYTQLYTVQNQVLIVHSVVSLFLVVLVAVRYILKEKLKKKQLVREKLHNKYLKFLKENSFEFLLVAIHPNLLTKQIILTVTEPQSGQEIPLELNIVFQIILQLRIYILFFSIITTSVYCNTRANRLCRIYSTKNNLFFGIKALFEYKPLTFLIMLYMGLVVSLAQMISLSEKKYVQSFEVFQNSVWFVIITMGTVGYGDYSPLTYLGRVISFTAAISGIIISSFLILTLSRYLSMSTGENKSHVTLKRLQLRRMLQKYSQQTINFTTSMILQKQLKNNPVINSQQNKKLLQELKKKTQRVKFAIRRIKNIVDSDNLKEEINRLFEALAESLNQIYKFQQEYVVLLKRLYKKEKQTINKIQFSFTNQIEKIIKDR